MFKIVKYLTIILFNDEVQDTDNKNIEILNSSLTPNRYCILIEFPSKTTNKTIKQSCWSMWLTNRETDCDYVISITISTDVFNSIPQKVLLLSKQNMFFLIYRRPIPQNIVTEATNTRCNPLVSGQQFIDILSIKKHQKLSDNLGIIFVFGLIPQLCFCDID